MQTILITGGTGLVGQKLTTYLLEKQYKIIILTRDPASQKEIAGVRYAAWDIKSGRIDINAVQQADFIIHLAGAPVMEKRWTAAYKQEILESRTRSSLLIAETLRQNTHHVKAIISSSAIGWYGKDEIPRRAFIETDIPSEDFLGQTSLAWEQSIETAANQEISVCKLRTGIVLSEKGGALDEFIKPLKFGIATILGSGKQMISWIHIDDLCGMFYHSIKEGLSGSYNAVAPKPVTNKEMVTKLAKQMKGNFYIPIHVPTPALKIILGERSVEILKSATVSAQKMVETGFHFNFPDIDSALKQISENID